jgi:hypothetical protein
MTLVDTSVWIYFFKGHETLHVTLLESLLIRGEDLATCGIILTEVLQGIQDEKQFAATEMRFNSLIFLHLERTTFVTAANIYRVLYGQNIVLQKPTNCILAAVALEHNTEFLHKDQEFDLIAQHFPLQVIECIEDS